MSASLTPLELPGWLEFNAWRTGLRAHRFSTGTDGGSEALAVFYLDKRGRVKLPTTNPYLPVVFRSERHRPSGRTVEWLRVATLMAEEMKRRGTANQLYLPPDVVDVRPWQWCGFLVGVRYTYHLDFPLDPGLIDRGQSQNAQKAARLGMTVDRVTDVDRVIECLVETEARHGFSAGIGHRELSVAQTLLDPENLRMYVCFDSHGHAASSCVVLHAPGARAIGWVAGSRTKWLADGAGHLMWRRAFDDLASAGAAGIDLAGANIGSVAAFKSRWGSRLVPNYSVRTYSMRTGARFLVDWRESSRRADEG